jgi:hypothetical protein
MSRRIWLFLLMVSTELEEAALCCAKTLLLRWKKWPQQPGLMD